MGKHTYIGDPKIVIAEKMTYQEYTNDSSQEKKDGYKVKPDKGRSYWLSENEFESKCFKIGNSCLVDQANKFKDKLRLHKSVSLKTKHGVQKPSIMISNACLAIMLDWAVYGLLEE